VTHGKASTFGNLTAREAALIGTEALMGAKQTAFVDTHKPLIAEALGDLRRGLAQLAEALQSTKFAVVYEAIYRPTTDEEQALGAPPETVASYVRLSHGESVAAPVNAYCTIDLGPEERINTPVKCPGAIGVTDARIIHLAMEVNRLKDVVKARFQPATNKRVTVTVNRPEGPVTQKVPMALYILRQLQQSSLNRIGAYKSIPLIRTERWEEEMAGRNRRRAIKKAAQKDYHPDTPLKIGFTAAWTGSYQKQTLKELKTEALKKRWVTVTRKLNRLSLREDELLYKVPTLYLRMRANLWFPGRTPKDRLPKNYMGELPILFLLSKNQAPPEISGPNPRGFEAPESRPTFELKEQPIYSGSSFYQRRRVRDREYR